MLLLYCSIIIQPKIRKLLNKFHSQHSVIFPLILLCISSYAVLNYSYSIH